MVTVNECSNHNIFPNNSPIGEVATINKHEEFNVHNDYMQPVLTCNDINISTVLINNNTEQNFDSIFYDEVQNVDTTYPELFDPVNTACDKIFENLEVSVSHSFEMNRSQSHSNNNEDKQKNIVTINDSSSQNIFFNNNPNYQLSLTDNKNEESKINSDYLQPISTSNDANINTELIHNERGQKYDFICDEVAQNRVTTNLEIFNSVSITNDESSQYFEVSSNYSNEVNQSGHHDHMSSVSKLTITQRMITSLSRLSKHRLETIVVKYLSNNACILSISQRQLIFEMYVINNRIIITKFVFLS